MVRQKKRKKDKEEGKADPEYFLIGGAVDTILTGEKGEFEKQYYVSQLDKLPSEVEIQIIGDVFMELVNNNVIDQVNFEDCYDAILASADADKDTFVEIVSLINSVDLENDNALATVISFL